MTVDKSVVKRHGVSVGLSLVISSATILSMLWAVGKPWLAEAVAQEITSDIKRDVELSVQAQVKEQLDPIKEAFMAQLRGQISAVKREIARMEYRRESGDWTEEDAIALSEMRSNLASQEYALSRLRNGTQIGSD